MQRVRSIGQPWTGEELKSCLREFADLYSERPIKDNSGGMSAPHLFYTWFALQKLQPKLIVESGVWLGQGTWLIEKACPRANIVCIEPAPHRIQYRSNIAIYETRDFSRLDWSNAPKSETVLLFDDHQNAYERLKEGKWFGFKHFLFEDNYPASQGDCYSLKKVFMCKGFNPKAGAAGKFKSRIGQIIKQTLGLSFGDQKMIEPNGYDAKLLEENLDIYFEFPPIFRVSDTRWNEPWDDHVYPTPDPLCEGLTEDDFRANEHLRLYYDQAKSYTWLCYARLR